MTKMNPVYSSKTNDTTPVIYNPSEGINEVPLTRTTPADTITVTICQHTIIPKAHLTTDAIEAIEIWFTVNIPSASPTNLIKIQLTVKSIAKLPSTSIQSPGSHSYSQTVALAAVRCPKSKIGLNVSWRYGKNYMT